MSLMLYPGAHVSGSGSSARIWVCSGGNSQTYSSLKWYILGNFNVKTQSLLVYSSILNRISCQTVICRHVSWCLEQVNFAVMDGVLYYFSPAGPALPDHWRLAVPESLQMILMKKHHHEKFAGHVTEQKKYTALSVWYWWQRMNDMHHFCLDGPCTYWWPLHL